MLKFSLFARSYNQRMVSPTRAFLAVITVVLMAIMMGSCKIDQDRKADPEKFTFEVRDDADLFFRNVRQIYYDRSSPDGKWQAYRFSDQYTGQDRPMITPVIVIQWLKDEAYLLVESNPVLENEDALIVTIEADTISLRERGRERMLQFASQIYDGLQEKKRMQIKVNNEFIPFLTEDSDRESFRVVMGDFYRLTGVY